MGSKIVILDCNGDNRPAVCFNLEVAQCETRIVFDEQEAVNLLEIARYTGESFDCLLVNNPYLNVDLSWIAEQGQRIETDIPIVFVKQSKPLQQIVESMSRQYPDLQLYFSEPTEVAELVQRLATLRRQEHQVGKQMKNQKKAGWIWRW